MEKLSLKAKLSLLLVVSVVSLVAVAVVGTLVARTASHAVNELGNVRLPSVNLLQIINEGQTAIRAATLTTAIYENDYQAQQQFARVTESRKQIWARIEKAWKEYEVLEMLPEEERLWKAFVPAWNEWKSTDARIAEVITSLSAAKSEEEQKKAFEVFYQRFAQSEPLFQRAEDSLGKVVQINVDVAGRDAAAYSRQMAVAQNTIVPVSVVALILLAGLLAVLARSILRQIGGEPAYAAQVVNRIAAGDLSSDVEIKSGDNSSLLRMMKDMQECLRDTVLRIQGASGTIASATNQIAAGNADLSSRTEQQASSLEETASSMEELTGTVKQNAENARQANQLAAGASTMAVKGGEVVGQVVNSMSSINESSRKIADIIGVIDGIAFQTNILALNAAVEAARAGEQGRGFAVVASEVRTLAQRSAAAAKEIKALITDSVGKVEDGSKLVDQAGQTMEEIVTAVKRVTDIMAEIAAASQEQTAGIEQVNQAIVQMDQVTQQNAALVEEAAAAAESMKEQAQGLTQSVAIFKLAQGEGRRLDVAMTPSSRRVPRGEKGSLLSRHEKGEGEGKQSADGEIAWDGRAERRSPNRAKNVARLAKPEPKPARQPSASKTANSDENWQDF